MACFSTGAAIGGAVGGALTAGSGSAAAGASLEAVQLTTLVSRELHDHWKAYYKQCDADAISEVCAIPVYVAPSATFAGRQRLEVIRTIGRKRQLLYRGQNVYHVGKMAQDCNVIAALEASAALDASEWGYRRGQNLEIQRNQRRLENIYAYLGLGRNLLSNALGAAALAGAIGAQLGAEQGKRLAGWSQFLGFLNTKEGKQFSSDVFGGIANVFRGGDRTGEGVGGEGALAQTIGGESGLGSGTPSTTTYPADAGASTIPDEPPPAGSAPLTTGNASFENSFGGGQ